jgi:hypothetical protein
MLRGQAIAQGTARNKAVSNREAWVPGRMELGSPLSPARWGEESKTSREEERAILPVWKMETKQTANDRTQTANRLLIPDPFLFVCFFTESIETSVMFLKEDFSKSSQSKAPSKDNINPPAGKGLKSTLNAQDPFKGELPGAFIGYPQCHFELRAGFDV